MPNERVLESVVDGGFSVVCLCAEWCGTCREYRDGFGLLATRFPAMRFQWVDIEEHADDLGDLDIENFPTVLIRRGALILFFGVLLPHLSHLQRMLETFAEQSEDEARVYARSAAERAAWQDDPDLQQLGWA